MPVRVVRSQLRQLLLRKDAEMRRELTVEMRAIGYELKAKHEQVVKDWKNKPVFKIGYSITPYRIFVRVFADGKNAKIWQYVNEGTKAHLIFPRVRGTKLKFRTGYEAKTAPVAKVNAGGGRSTGNWVATEGVSHPGTEARKFTETFDDELKQVFRRRIEAAIKRAVRRR